MKSLPIAEKCPMEYFPAVFPIAHCNAYVNGDINIG